MNAARSLLTRILASVVLVPALTSQAIAGFFPGRPPGATVQKFTGVIVEYGFGNDTGGFVLTIGGKRTDFYIGLPMRMNGAVVRCQDPDPAIASPGSCTDWPSAIVLGKSVVTATCWTVMFSPDMAMIYTPGMSTSTPEPTLFCDEIDSVPRGPKP
jgi:hypothetical protein